MTSEERKVLVVDDEEKIVEVVRSYLENSGYVVSYATNGNKALELFDVFKPDLVVLDLMLPDLNGIEVCKALRKKSRVPIIMLTARVDEEDKLIGLDMGADDYITKPFSPRELVGRVRAVLRRVAHEMEPLSNSVSFNDDDLEIDFLNREIRKNGRPVNVTPNEYSILVTLARYPKKVFTRDELVSSAFGMDYEGFDRTIDSHIKNLRQKIEDDSKHPQYIVTVYGVGYRFGGV